MMLKRLELENFKSIRQLDLELGSLNVLIGRNGSGKSNFLSFFQFMRDAAEGKLFHAVNQVGGFSQLRCLKAQEYDVVRWQLEFSLPKDNAYYEARLSPREFGYTIQYEQLSRPPFPTHERPYKFLEVRNNRITILQSSNEVEDASEDTVNQELALAQIRAGRYPALAEARSYIEDWQLFRGFGQIELATIRSSQLLNAIDPLRLDSRGSNLRPSSS